MKKNHSILFVNGNLHGHINPTLPVVRELVQEGAEVCYFSTLEFKSKLEAAGAIFMDYGKEFDDFLQSFRPHGSHPFYTLMEYMLALDRTVIPIVIDKTKGLDFDCIVHDVMFGGGNILAKKLNLPSIASCSSFVMERPPLPARMLEPGFHPQLDYLLSELNSAKNEWEADHLTVSDIFFKKASETLVYTSRLFQPAEENYGTEYRFVGPSILERDEFTDFSLDKTASDKLIYISMGTINNNMADFYNQCIRAFTGTPYRVVMSIGNKIDVSSIQAPDNYVIRNYVPQLEILKHADVFICHGGLNSVSEALYYGVPVIAIPLVNDQPAVAKRLTELGAGLELKLEEITPEILTRSVHTILSLSSYQDNCIRIGASFRDAGGYRKAAEEIIRFIHKANDRK